MFNGARKVYKKKLFDESGASNFSTRKCEDQSVPQEKNGYTRKRL